MDMRSASGICDYFVITGAESTRKVKAIGDAVREGLSRKGMRVLHAEGERESLWVLLDFGDVVVHIFQNETRRFYNLERLWHDAHKEYLSDTWDRSESKKHLTA